MPYADLSDFFYVWLRRNLKEVYPDLFRTLLTPKAEELIADPFRHGGKEEARKHFEEGMRRVFRHLRERAHPDYPLTLYYAFKQQEVEEDEEGESEAVASTAGRPSSRASWRRASRWWPPGPCAPSFRTAPGARL